ncbi:hypothetical protein [uncultured Arsenicicoccus sp.]|nr:hypothetical protein [uncultured Arsenicicoccus sp.]
MPRAPWPTHVVKAAERRENKRRAKNGRAPRRVLEHRERVHQKEA